MDGLSRPDRELHPNPGDSGSGAMRSDLLVPESSGTAPSGTPRVVRRMLERMSDAYLWWSPNFALAEQDMRFAYSEQWDPNAKSKRGRQSRPALTMNQIPEYINKVVGAARQSRFSVHVTQSGGVQGLMSAAAGRRTPAEVVEGIVRDIEHRSNAGHEYTAALQNAVESGFGWLRVRTEWRDDNPFFPEAVVERVKHRFSVLMDPLARDATLADADWGTVSAYLTRRQFEAHFPSRDSSTVREGSAWDGMQPEFLNWYGRGNHVTVTDYYWKEPAVRTALRLEHLESGESVECWRDEVAPVLDEMADRGWIVAAEKRVSTSRVFVARCSAREILEGPWVWPGTSIPIVLVPGRQVDFKDRTEYFSLHRHAHDAQRMANLNFSNAMERNTLSPKATWVATEDQLAGRETEWRDDNVNLKRVLLYRHLEGVPMPSRVAGAEPPVSEFQLLAESRRMVMDTIGIHQAGLGAKSNETSGRAILQRQAASDQGSYEFVDNLALAVGQVGRILVQVIPRIYRGRAAAHILLPDGRGDTVQLGLAVQDRGSGREIAVDALSMSRFSCVAHTGPQADSVKHEFNSFLLSEWGKTNPEVLRAVIDYLVLNMGIDNSREIAGRLRRLIPRDALSEEEKKELPPPEPTPEQQAKMMESQAKIAEAKSAQAVAELDLEKQRILLETAVAKAAEAEADMEGHGPADDGRQLEQMVKRIVAEALAAKGG